MDRKRLILTIFAVLLAQFGCQQPSTTAMEPKTAAEDTLPTPITVDTKGPRITFEKLVHDFGSVKANSKNTCEFKFTNTGDSLLKIKRVKPSCPVCITARLSKKEYAPGESGTLKVIYEVGERQGPTQKSVYVSSNDKANPKIRLALKADIELKVDYEPRRLNLSLRDVNCPKITIKSLDGLPFAIKAFKSTGNLVTADYTASEKKTNFVLQPKVDMNKLRKIRTGRIDITLTHPKCSKITMPFNVLQEFSISPPRIIILKAKPQKLQKREIWVLSNYNEDFEIESVSTKNDIIKVLSRERIGNRYKFELEITPPLPQLDQRMFEDTFFVNIKNSRKLKLNCNGFYQKTLPEPPDE